MASPTLSVTLDDVRAAQDLLSGVVRPTPLEYSRALSDRVGAEVFLKCENLQRAGSFKIRGAYTRMARLSDAEKSRGVVAASAGNHAQGVALAGQLLGIDVKVYMPHWLRVIAEWNPISSLVQAVRQLWGNDLPVPADAQLPMHHPILTTLIWTIGLTVVIAPLAIRAFQRRVQQ